MGVVPHTASPSGVHGAPDGSVGRGCPEYGPGGGEWVLCRSRPAYPHSSSNGFRRTPVFCALAYRNGDDYDQHGPDEGESGKRTVKKERPGDGETIWEAVSP